MTAGTIHPAAPGPAAPRPAARSGRSVRVTQTRVMRSEWTKLTSLRSTVWTMLVAVVLIVGLGLLFCALLESHWSTVSPGDKLTFDATTTSETGMYLAQLAVGVLGVLVMTGEYSTGMIRASFGAVPRRLPVLWAKAAVFGLASFALMFVALLVTFLAGQAILAGQDIGVSLWHAAVIRSLVGTAFYLTAVGLIGMFLGTMLRASGGAIAALVGLVLIIPIIFAALPGSWSDNAKYLPSNAGEALSRVGYHSSDTLGPLAGLVVLLAYLVVTGAGAAWLLARRDA
jgi:ABC-2 type transport system permease protein